MIGPIHFVTWDNRAPSGGNTYDRELVAALRATGSAVDVTELAGSWPAPSTADLDRLADVLLEHAVSLVDGIVACGAPGPVAGAVRAGRQVGVLVHMALADERNLDPAERRRRELAEGEALRVASVVVCTSRFAADDVAARHGLAEVRVARPGVRPAAPARGSGDVPRLLSVANLTPTKDQLTLVRALGRLRDLDWTASLVGSPAVDPDYAARVRTEVAHLGLADRVQLPGALQGPELEAQWVEADLLLLTSRTETFGLVVLEALAHGVPAVVTAGTGAVEALAMGTVGPDGGEDAAWPERWPVPGCTVPPGDPDALAEVLRAWLTDPVQRRAWRRTAVDRRRELPGWDATAAAVLDALG